MLFLYRLQMFSYMLRNIKDIFLKLIFISIYLYCFGIILTAFNEGLSSTLSYSNPKNIVLHTYHYLKWWYYNSNLLTYSVVFKVVVSLIIPYFVYRSLCNIKWKTIFKKTVTFLYNKKTAVENVEQSEGVTQNLNSNISQGELDLIRRTVMRDIERLVDKRLMEIFVIRKRIINERLEENKIQENVDKNPS